MGNVDIGDLADKLQPTLTLVDVEDQLHVIITDCPSHTPPRIVNDQEFPAVIARTWNGLPQQSASHPVTFSVPVFRAAPNLQIRRGRVPILIWD